MRIYLVILSCCWFNAVLCQSNSFYKETYRPQFHFTPAIHWMNDPNGLVYHKGEYHLFYQFNPFGNRWGHMSWGHAVSKDLLYWQHLPLAIPEEKDTMIFSGSCIVDKNNSSGFAKRSDQVPMVAVYTAHIEGLSQSQHIAYSLDEGRSWVKYDHNPVLDLHKKDFRDPKVFWYEPHQKWVMAVVLPIEKQVQFYSSKNLKQWDFMSSFGPAGDTSGIWECPDLFEVPVQNEKGKTKWVLMHSPAPYMQYFIGGFDGTSFINENDSGKIYRPDYGSDYYAAIVYNNLPSGHKPVSIGWVNNWNYANDIPTSPWKSAMSLPRELSVRKINNKWILMQQPVEKISQLRTTLLIWKNKLVETKTTLPVHSQTLEMEVSFIVNKKAITGIRLAKENNAYLEIGYDAVKQELYIDRSNAGDTNFHPTFAKLKRSAISLLPQDGRIKLQIFFDKSIVEIFANGGQVVLTNQIFPGKKQNGAELFSTGKTIFESVRLYEMKSVW